MDHLVINFRRSLRSYGGLKSQDVEKIQIFETVKIRPLTGTFSIKFCFERIHCNTDRRVVFIFREIWLTEIGKIVHTVRAQKRIQYSAEA